MIFTAHSWEGPSNGVGSQDLEGAVLTTSLACMPWQTLVKLQQSGTGIVLCLLLERSVSLPFWKAIKKCSNVYEMLFHACLLHQRALGQALDDWYGR